MSIMSWLHNLFVGEDMAPRNYQGFVIRSFLEKSIVDVGLRSGRTPEKIQLALVVHRHLDVPFH